MNKKAKEVSYVGLIILVTVGVLVGIALFTGVVADNIGRMTRSYDLVNYTVTVGASNATTDLVGQELLSTPVVYNASNATGIKLSGDNYTIAEGISSTTGLKRIQITMNSSEFASQALNFTYAYGHEGYVDSSGGRSVVSLIAIFFALAIAFVAIYPVARSKIADWFKR